MSQTRRHFLKHGAATLLGTTALAPIAFASLPSGTRWSETYDVIVVGSGVAAASAAIAALDKKCRVTMLEKMPVLGGTSVISNGTIAIVGSPQQKKKGITGDSVDIFLADVMKEGDYFNQPHLAKTLVGNSLRAYEFLTEHGAMFEDYVIKFPGLSVDRLLQPVKNSTNGIMNPLYTYYAQKGGLTKKRCRVDAIVLDNQGHVAGVKVRENYHFDPELRSDDIENKSGHVKYYRATRGVVCGTGGFNNDQEFRAQDFPQLRNIYTTQQIGATASGFRLMANAGARMVHTPFYRPAFPETASMMLGMMVDVTTGKRFTAETSGRVQQFLLTSKLLQKNGFHLPVSILDADAHELVGDKHHFNIALDAGTASKHNSIEELAAYYNIPLDILKTTIRDYNTLVDNGVDTDFKSNLELTKRNKVDRAPFYGLLVRPDINSNQGGALINERAEVIGLNTNQPIPGLYAAGEATGGVLGASRLLGCAMLNGVVFGMLAGENAATRQA